MRGTRLVALGCLTATLVACNFTIPGSEPLPTYFVIPTLTPSPPAAEGQIEEGGEAVGTGEEMVEGGAVVGDEDLPLVYQGTNASVDMLDSYETAFTMSQTTTEAGGAPVSFNYVVTQAFSRDPLASRLLIDVEGTDPSLAGQSGNFELVQMGDTTYFITAQPGQPTECLSFSTADSAPFEGAVYSPETFLAGGDYSGAQRILPNENVNGVLARHYRVTETVALLAYPGLDRYVVDIYVATLEGYDVVVRETFSADGEVEGSAVQVEWTYDLLNVNGPVNIGQPEGCAPPAGADFPTMPDATDVTTFGGVVSYTTASSATDVQAFYNQQLPAQGWTPGPVSDLSGFVTMEFTRGDESASINITEGNVIVTLTP